MKQEELNIILEEHKKWLRGDADGICADLSGAGLRYATLIDANLIGADLTGADLCGADLCGANLRGANLTGADLRGAYLRHANLCNAELIDANLTGADLSGSNLTGADLRGAKNIPFLPQLIACPLDGSFTAYKKLDNNLIAKLLIPEDAKRSNSTTRKCRCDKAVVVAIYDEKGKEFGFCFSKYDNSSKYEVGKWVIADNFDEYRWNECSTGIHFFMSKQEAIDY